MTILKELQNWKNRVNIIEKKNTDNSVLTKEVEDIEKEIFKLYQTLFKNLVSKRVNTETPKKSEDSYNLCLNKEGFSYLWKHGYNSDYITKFKQLEKVLELWKEIIRNLPKANKKRLLRVWGKEFNKLKTKEFEIELKLKEEKELKQFDDDNETKIKNMKYLGYTISFYEDKQTYSDESFDFGSLSTDDYVTIEQFYPQINKILDNYKKKMIKMRKERDKLLTNLREEFSSELILDRLKVENVK